MTRILFLTKVPPFGGGGAESVIWDLGRYLADREWDVHYLCPLSVADDPPAYENVTFHDVPTPSGYLSGRAAFFVSGILEYRRLVRRLSPDVVYDNMSPFPFVAAHLGAEQDRVVTKIHGIEGLSALRNKPHLLTKVGSVLGYEFLRVKSGERILSVSESCAEQIRKRVRRPQAVTVMQNGIEMADFDPSFSPDGPVLALCLMTPKKGVQYLLRAWKRVEDAGHTRELLVAGSGPSLAEFQQLARDLDLENVRFLGYVSEERKRELYSEAFAYVLPTRAEGLVLTNLEAMASKCLVVSTPVDGVRDYLTGGVNGITTAPESPGELANALRSALADPERYRALAEAGYETVESSYQLDDALDRERRYLRSVIEE